MGLDVQQLLRSAAAVATGHFVYKSGKHGPGYVNKEAFATLGATQLFDLYRAVGVSAASGALGFGDERRVAVIGPAYGAIAGALAVACGFEAVARTTRFFPTRTQLDPQDRHVLPQKLIDQISGLPVVISEDIVNAGRTVREVAALVRGLDIGCRVVGAVCVVDRGGQTEETLGVPVYAPLQRIDMTQYDPREYCPLCAEGRPIDLVLGKGKAWVDLFGQPSYPSGMDLSAYPFEG